MTIILAFWLFGVGFCLWGMICNHRTHSDRASLREFIFSQPNWDDLLRKFRLVPYEKHLRRRFFLRDASSLYAQPLKAVLRGQSQ